MYVQKRFVPRQQNETSNSRMTLNETNTRAESLSTVHFIASLGMRNYYIGYEPRKITVSLPWSRDAGNGATST